MTRTEREKEQDARMAERAKGIDTAALRQAIKNGEICGVYRTRAADTL